MRMKFQCHFLPHLFPLKGISFQREQTYNNLSAWRLLKSCNSGKILASLSWHPKCYRVKYFSVYKSWFWNNWSLLLQIKFLNPLITRRPKLRRQRKIFRQQGKMPRPDQMNINVATWGRLLKRNLNFQKSMTNADHRSEGHSSSTGELIFYVDYNVIVLRS